MKYKAWFQCSSGCDEHYELNEIIYNCKKCGGLLEVQHDVEKLKHRSPGSWMRLFDDRYRRNKWPFGSSVWGKKEMVCPNVENHNVVSLYEGGSNLFWAERLGNIIGIEDLWIKQCGNAHTGSFKDLGMTVLVSMVKQMISEGKDIMGVACASTGDTSAALSAYCAAAGIPAIVFLPKNKVSTAQLVQPIANGALTLSLDTDFDGCMEIVQKVCRENNIYLANSMNSLRIEGQKTVSIELVQQLDWEVPDVIIIPGGNLGNVTALGKGFLLMKELGMINRLPRIVCVQAAKANPLYQSYLNGFKEFKPIQAQMTLASAIQIGNPVSINKAIKMLKLFNGVVEQATEDELANAAALADRTGLFNCPHTGVALAALFKLLKRNEIKKDERVVIISTAHGLKFTDFKVKYHENQLEEVESKYANAPVDLPPEYDKVKKTILDKISDFSKFL
ncbi:MAG: threonine synthase [Candidatus Scalindua sp.]|jgi:threonine synthase|nr:threonine synthase [Candidatus Scalindua sp.]MBT5306506.1 threonine synthase [Candidatus Scalindua sp.]MBT6226920.1 threonine synthase [Candidatus Scalindua sp.]MBT6563524.1 threonine synthase [Candidatus Scalindua sp.]MBT7213091.1 threonine synthase [Candidatus Scalindua sp.]